jgi:hypothetical protein
VTGGFGEIPEPTVKVRMRGTREELSRGFLYKFPRNLQKIAAIGLCVGTPD